MLRLLPEEREVVRSASRPDRVLLEGPHSRRKDLWLVLRTVRDFITGFRTLHFAGPCVTVFGSARYTESDPYYAFGRDVGRALEQAPNAYLDLSVTCRYFFVRKVLLFKYSYAFVALPGGLGTLDELMEALTLIQTRKIAEFPVVLLGTSYWRPLEQLLQQLAHEGTIDARDLEWLLVTDSVAAALAHIHRHTVDAFGLTVRHATPLGVLREHGLENGMRSAPSAAGWRPTLAARFGRLSRLL